MNHISQQAIDQNPTLKAYCLALKQVGFQPKNHSKDSKSFKILAEKNDTHLQQSRLILILKKHLYC